MQTTLIAAARAVSAMTVTHPVTNVNSVDSEWKGSTWCNSLRKCPCSWPVHAILQLDAEIKCTVTDISLIFIG